MKAIKNTQNLNDIQNLKNLYRSHVITSELMFSGMIDLLLTESVKKITDYNLYRQKIKLLTKEILAVKEHMLKTCSSCDKNLVTVSCQLIFPFYKESYLTNAGTLSEHLILMFHKEWKKEIRGIESLRASLFSEKGLRYADLAAVLKIAELLSVTMKELRETLDSRIKPLSPIYSFMGADYEKLYSLIRKLLSEIGVDKIVYSESEMLEIKIRNCMFQTQFLKEDMMGKIESMLDVAKMDYINFIIASIRLDLLKGEGKLPFGCYRSLLFRMGTKKNVLGLLEEINKLPLPEDGDNARDYQCSLQENEGFFISHFRRLSLEDKIMVDNSTIKLRSLRVIAERNDGVLPLEVLQSLYRKLKTKKAVRQILMKAGPEMNKSINFLDKTACSKLKSVTKKLPKTA